MKKILILILVVVSLSSCASIVSESSYPVQFTSNPSESNIIIVNDMDLEIYSGKTPSIVELSSKKGFFAGAEYTVTVSKDGYTDKTFTLKSTLDGWYIGNILFGGLIGALIVDPATGAMWALPTSTSTTLSKDIAADTTYDLEIYGISELSQNEIDDLIRIN